ncbi:MAG: heme/hemopexin-binding protein precursor [Bacillota bacterium]
MSKSLSLLLSSLALATGVASLTVSLIVPGPQGSNGSAGPQGPSGEPGSHGSDGANPVIGVNGNWWVDGVDTGVQAIGMNANELQLPQVNPQLTQAELMLSQPANYPDLSSPILQQTYIQDLVNTQGYIPISTVETLMGINDVDGKYILTRDISFVNVGAWSPINILNENNQVLAFEGVLDGAGYKISNLTYASFDATQEHLYYGLFDWLNGATIANLTLDNFNFYSNAQDNMGLIAGRAENSIIGNIRVYNSLISSIGNAVGGLVGSTLKTLFIDIVLDQVSLYGDVSVGGVTGEAFQSGFIRITTNNLSIDGKVNHHGGITGFSSSNFYRYIQSDFFIYLGGNSLAVNRYGIGGVTGASYFDRFFDVLTTGEISFITLDEFYFLTDVGGVTGYASNSIYVNVTNQIPIVITYNQALLNVTLTSIGGIIGSTDFATLHQVFNTGDVIIQYDINTLDFNLYVDAEEHPIEYIGGIIGYVYGSVNLQKVVNDGNITGIKDVAGLIGSTGIPMFFLQQFVYMNEVANFGMITGILDVGGLFGINDYRTSLWMNNAVNYGDVFGNNRVGGLIGRAVPGPTALVRIVNSYNRGSIYLVNSQGSGIIGSTFPYGFMFDNIWGEIELYNVFNVGLILPERFGEENLTFVNFASGAILGTRLILTTMYSVSYLDQTSSYQEVNYDGDQNLFIPTGRTLYASVMPVGEGNQIDATRIESRDYFYNPDQFVYRSAWDFETIWTSDELMFEGLPYLQIFETFLNLD